MAMVRRILQLQPLLFGLGFLAPLIAQSLQKLGLNAPFGLSAVIMGLLIGGSWGAVATLRGRWL